MNDPALWLPIFTLVTAGLTALFLRLAMRALRRGRLVDDLPTSKTAGVFIGLVECHGTAESEAPFTSFLAEVRCVHHAWSVDEHWQRTVTETYTDSKGNTQTRTRTESGSTTVASGGESAPFWLRDDTGVVQVDPDKSDLRCKRVFQENVRRSDPLYYSKGPSHSVTDSTHRRTFTEYAIPLHHELYVIGRSQLDEEATAPLIAHDPESPLFVISTQGEESVSKGYVWGLRGWTLLALLTNFGAVFTLFASMAELDGPRLDPAGADLPLFVTVSVLLFVLVWTLCWIWQVYNALVGLRQRSLRGDSLIDIELERRSDLIPRLVEIVKAMADHEQETQAALARMRSQARATDASATEAVGLASDLRMVVERHPDLKSNQLFSDLQDRLVDTEDRIARARAYANELGANYNTRLEVVPDRWVAALAKLRPRPMFAVDAFERRAVTVDLAD